MKILYTVLIALLLLTACSNEPQPEPIAQIIGQCGNSDISIRDIKGKKRDDGFMLAQVIGYNDSSEYQLLESRIVWFDKDGFKIESILSKYKEVPAHAKQPFYINEVSPNTKAKTFRVYIRKNEEIICNKQSN